MFINEKYIAECLSWESIIQSIKEIFISGCEMPPRPHYTLKQKDTDDATLLLMPAWINNEYVGVKQINFFPGNRSTGQPAISGLYSLSCGKSGEVLAVLDGAELTARRTAAASALASSFLSRKNSETMLMVGTGRLAYNLIMAHASQRPLKKINIWGVNHQQLEALGERVSNQGFNVELFEGADIQKAASSSDIISCATPSTQPLIFGDWLKEGTHLDLVGGFRPDMREADDVAIGRAKVFVDIHEAATSEAGDILTPVERGVISLEDINADLYGLCRGLHQGRDSDIDITFYKSVGGANEDLAAAILAYKTYSKDNE